MKKLMVLLLCMSVFVFIAEASKNEKKNKVKSVTQYATVYDKGKPVTYKESYEEYDKNGKNTLKIDYKKDGTIDSKKTFKYNSDGDKIEEVEYNAAGAVEKKTTFTYNAQGEKDTENNLDAAGKILKKSTYSYNAKDLKTEKKTVNGSNVLESVKKWEYSFY